MKSYQKMLALTALYTAVGILTYLLWTQAEGLRPFWFAAVGVGVMFFALEQRTGLSLTEKVLPLYLLLLIMLWAAAVRRGTFRALLQALFFTLVPLSREVRRKERTD